MCIEELKEKVCGGYKITKKEACKLYEAPIDELCEAANEIREAFCGNYFDFCTIVNGKSGKCSEDCKFCAQSAAYHSGVEVYALQEKEELVRQAEYNAKHGIMRYSIVTSGKCLSESEIDQVCDSVREIRERTGQSVCASFGLLNKKQYEKIKAAGITRIHNNLESAENYFPKVCTTHSFQDKVRAILQAKEAGMQVCSGGIIGIGESVSDRIDMAITLRELDIHSVPINRFTPILGTPFEYMPEIDYDMFCRTVAVYRFILPKAYIRLAGGRGLLPDFGAWAFESGANAAISGDMLTTDGISIEKDMELVQSLGFKTREE